MRDQPSMTPASLSSANFFFRWTPSNEFRIELQSCTYPESSTPWTVRPAVEIKALLLSPRREKSLYSHPSTRLRAHQWANHLCSDAQLSKQWGKRKSKPSLLQDEQKWRKKKSLFFPSSPYIFVVFRANNVHWSERKLSLLALWADFAM